MIELIWRLEHHALDREDRVAPLFEALAETPGFEPDDYDLNQKEQWREFDRKRTVVDALTQRTQLVRVRGETSETIAMVAMGKHGEQPTVVVRLPDPATLDDLVDAWPGLVDEIGIRMALITSEAWRDALDRANLLWEDEVLSPALVYGWPTAQAPDWLSEVRRDSDGVFASTPISVETRETCTILWLATAGEWEGEDHRRGIAAIADFAT